MRLSLSLSLSLLKMYLPCVSLSTTSELGSCVMTHTNVDDGSSSLGANQLKGAFTNNICLSAEPQFYTSSFTPRMRSFATTAFFAHAQFQYNSLTCAYCSVLKRSNHGYCYQLFLLISLPSRRAFHHEHAQFHNNSFTRACAVSI